MQSQRLFCLNGYMKFFQVYRDQIKPDAPTLLDAPGVSYSTTVSAYQLALVAHLPGNLNGGGHAVYVDVLGEDGQPLQNPPLRIGWTWDGRQTGENAPPVALDKGPLDASAGNVVIYKGMNLALWLQDGDRITSDIVSGLQTATPDADPATGNSRFHNSFYVVFRKRTGWAMPQPPQPVTLEDRMKALEVDVVEIRRRLGM